MSRKFISHGRILRVFAAIALLLSGCSRQEPPRSGERIVPVVVDVAQAKDVPVQIRAIGSVEAYSTVQMTSLVGGELRQVHFTEGSDVKKGDVLFTIDARPFETALRQAESTLAKDVALARNADLEAKRAEDLMKTESTSQQAYDQALARQAAAHAQVAADKALVENARLNLAYCTIRSPVDGRTGSLMVNEGNVVKANDVALVTINQLTPIYVAFAVPERNLGELRQRLVQGDLAVEAVVPERETTPETGKLTFINNSVDKATGTILLKGTFENQNHVLWPGQFVNVIMTLSRRPNAVVVAAETVQTGQQGQYVFVVTQTEGGNAQVEFRPVVAGIQVEDEVVIEEGLAAGETVVVDGQLQLLDKTRVQPRPVEPTKTVQR